MKTTRRWGVVALVAIAAVIASLFGATGAGAYLGTAASIRLTQTVVPQGGQTTVIGDNYAPNAPVELTLHSAGVAIGVAHTNAAGHFSQPVTIPATTVPGAHQIEGKDAFGDDQFADLTVTSTSPTTPAPAPSSSSGGLAGTGVAVVGIGALGIVLLVGGGLMLLAGRRRKNSTHAI